MCLIQYPIPVSLQSHSSSGQWRKESKTMAILMAPLKSVGLSSSSSSRSSPSDGWMDRRDIHPHNNTHTSQPGFDSRKRRTGKTKLTFLHVKIYTYIAISTLCTILYTKETTTTLYSCDSQVGYSSSSSSGYWIVVVVVRRR